MYISDERMGLSSLWYHHRNQHHVLIAADGWKREAWKEKDNSLISRLVSLVKPGPAPTAICVCSVPIQKAHFQKHFKKSWFKTLKVCMLSKQQVAPGTTLRHPERNERADKAAPSQNPAPVRHWVRHPETMGSKITTHFWLAQTTPEKHWLLSLLL